MKIENDYSRRNYRFYEELIEKKRIFFKCIYLYERINRIPITPELLTKFANTKIWKIDYPKHQIPKYRYDAMIDFVIFGGISFIVLYFSLKKYF